MKDFSLDYSEPVYRTRVVFEILSNDPKQFTDIRLSDLPMFAYFLKNCKETYPCTICVESVTKEEK
jgi:hypothetical protein